MLNNNLTIIILAGGEGKRMNSSLPKVLHTINGKPMLVHIIKEALLLNPSNLYIVVGKFRETIVSTLSQFIPVNNIVFIDQYPALGTGHAIQCCLSALQTIPEMSSVLVLSGDVPLLNKDIMGKMLYKLDKVCIAVSKFENPYGYGRIIQDELTNKFVKIIEEKDATHEEKQIKTVNCGLYSFRADMLVKYSPLLKNNNTQYEYYLTDLIELIKIGENTIVNMLEILQNDQYQIIGVNTIDQLNDLEKMFQTKSKDNISKINSLLFRPLDKNDYNKKYIELLSQLSDVSKHMITSALFDKFIDNLCTNQMIYVLEDEDKYVIVGTITIIIETKVIHNFGKVLHIEDVVVDKSYRGKNLGRLLIQNAIDIAKSNNCYKIILDCSDNNVEFYKKNGFEVKGNQMAIYF